MRKKIFLIPILLIILLSCNKTETKSVIATLNYENGNLYSSGKYKLSIKSNDTTYKQVGEWKIYFPNGKIRQIKKFDDNGEWLESSIYYSNGGLEIQSIKKDDIEESKWFHPNGVMFIIEKIKYTSETRGKEGETEVISEQKETKYFYENGMIQSEISEENDEIISRKVYDSLGNIQLNSYERKGREYKFN